MTESEPARTVRVRGKARAAVDNIWEMANDIFSQNPESHNIRIGDEFVLSRDGKKLSIASATSTIAPNQTFRDTIDRFVLGKATVRREISDRIIRGRMESSFRRPGEVSARTLSELYTRLTDAKQTSIVSHPSPHK